MRLGSGLTLLAAIATPAVARAQALSCALPGTIPVPHAADATPDQPRRIVPIGGYTLALTWSPEYCQGRIAGREAARGGREDIECGTGNRFGFTLHGLWPDGTGREWPQFCQAAPVLTPGVLRAHLCQTPSVQLMQHEWAKHGTCMPGYDPTRYFARSGALYARLRFPDMVALSYDRGLTVGRVAAAMATPNPGLPKNAIRLTVNRKGWLNEMWLCLDTRFAYTGCRADGSETSDDTPVKIYRGALSRGSSRYRGGAGRGAAG